MRWSDTFSDDHHLFLALLLSFCTFLCIINGLDFISLTIVSMSSGTYSSIAMPGEINEQTIVSPVKVVLATTGNNAGMLGCALLAIDNFSK